MASNDKWIRRVLFKLNELFLDGSDFDDRRWVFDWDKKLSLKQNIENVEAEDDALTTLTNADVIQSHSVENRYRSDQLDDWDLHGEDHLIHVNWYRDYDRDPALREYDYIRGLDGFSHKSFQHFCKLHGFNPSSESVIATLELLSDVTPVVKVQGEQYTLPTLAAGRITQEIVAHGAKHFDTQLSINDLQENIHATQLTAKGVNISQLFRKNIFTKTLSQFADISPKSFTLKHQALLSPSEIEAIRQASTR